MQCHEPVQSRCPCRSGVLGHLAGLVIGVVLVLLFGTAVMLLWNAIMPALVHAAYVSFWQSVGLLLLARILVGGFHPPHRFRGRRGLRGYDNATRRQYEEWWRDVGESSFQQYGVTRPENKEQK